MCVISGVMRAVYLQTRWSACLWCWSHCIHLALKNSSSVWPLTCFSRWPVAALTIHATCLSSHSLSASFRYCLLQHCKKHIYMLFIWIIPVIQIFFSNFSAFCSIHVFQDYAIDSNWRLRSTVLTPMFMETQATQGSGSQGSEAAGNQTATMRGQIRATQTSLEFSQTLAPGAGTS